MRCPIGLRFRRPVRMRVGCEFLRSWIKPGFPDNVLILSYWSRVWRSARLIARVFTRHPLAFITNRTGVFGWYLTKIHTTIMAPLLPELPVELWTLIIKHAITRPCDSNRFNPSTYNFDCVRGFASASVTFREIVQSLNAEVIVIVWDGFLAVNSEIARRTRYVLVRLFE